MPIGEVGATISIAPSGNELQGDNMTWFGDNAVMQLRSTVRRDARLYYRPHVRIAFLAGPCAGGANVYVCRVAFVPYERGKTSLALCFCRRVVALQWGKKKIFLNDDLVGSDGRDRSQHIPGGIRTGNWIWDSPLSFRDVGWQRYCPCLLLASEWPCYFADRAALICSSLQKQKKYIYNSHHAVCYFKRSHLAHLNNFLRHHCTYRNTKNNFFFTTVTSAGSGGALSYIPFTQNGHWQRLS